MPELKTKTVRKSFFTNDAEKSNIVKSFDVHGKKYSQVEKAFVAGTGITPETQPDGAAYRLESLYPE